MLCNLVYLDVLLCILSIVVYSNVFRCIWCILCILMYFDVFIYIFTVFGWILVYVMYYAVFYVFYVFRFLVCALYFCVFGCSM